MERVRNVEITSGKLCNSDNYIQRYINKFVQRLADDVCNVVHWYLIETQCGSIIYFKGRESRTRNSAFLLTGFV